MTRKPLTPDEMLEVLAVAFSVTARVANKVTEELLERLGDTTYRHQLKVARQMIAEAMEMLDTKCAIQAAAWLTQNPPARATNGNMLMVMLAANDIYAEQAAAERN